ncbi:MAG: alpha-amylase family glycosyl hydrolase [Dehalococcoidia bacterium]|nr:alpha-amylase family glycosyl hydrolase [Dehalococcoidia bacterium]
MPASREFDWWRRAVFYQVYPRSFADSNGDGVGDLRGIISRLDYLNDDHGGGLGVDAVWLSPTFPSPMADFGYDVADYCDVDPIFGTLDDMDELIAACHERGVALLLDYVPNHSSDQHPWFQESRARRDSAKRDWYVWRDPAPGGGPPNNWQSVFGGPAWTFDASTGQYYLHSFLPEQPDLNWRNLELVQAMHDVLRFWFRRGIDGFRIDVLGRLMKHPDLPDNPPPPDADPPGLRSYNHNFPDVFEAVRGMRAVADEFPGRVLVGEVFGSLMSWPGIYGGDALDGLHLAFNFSYIQERAPDYTPWEAPALRRIAVSADAAMPGDALPCWAFNNHDRDRFLSRQPDDEYAGARARGAALLLLGLRGVPVLYQGEEIGMTNGDVPEEYLQDPARFHDYSRDPVRTPMPWNNSPGRGFTTGEPWLPIGDQPTVAGQEGGPGSLLELLPRCDPAPAPADRRCIRPLPRPLDAGRCLRLPPRCRRLAAGCRCHQHRGIPAR